MSDMDESIMNSSYRGAGHSGSHQEDSTIANRPGAGSSKNKNLVIFNNISSENVAGGQHNNSNSFNKESLINQPSIFPSQHQSFQATHPKRNLSAMATEGQVF